MILTQYIPDLISEVVDNTAAALGSPVYYDFGHYAVVENNLVEKDGAPTLKDKKYPLIWLVMDFEEQIGGSTNYADVALHFIIAMGTSDTYSMQDRRDISFLPVLYPIYGELLNQFGRSAAFGMPSIIKIQHTKIDRPYWGIQSGSGNGLKNMFSDYIDAIELRNVKLSVKRKIC